MKQEVILAAAIRGCIIAKTGQPCIVAAAGKAPHDAMLSISSNDETEAETKIAEALAKFPSGTIPLAVEVKLGGNIYSYLCAPDFAGIEKIRSDEIKTAWKVTTGVNAAADFGASRSTVVKNRVAVVTGGAQGFGEEIVRGLVSAGALVFIADLNMVGAARLADILNKEYSKTVAFPVEVNVADEASVEKMTDTIALKTGGLDLCVSNAGVLRAASILEQDIASFKFVTDINYVAFAIVTKHCGLLMKCQNLCAPSWTTDIIQINSKSGLEGSNKNGSYAGGKFGSIGLVQSFAKELVDYRIKVNAVCPGNFFDGPLWSDPEKGLFVQYLKTGKVPGAKTVADVKTFYESKVPMGRGCTGPDVIRAVLYLVEQIYETGQALPVTGGQVMLN
ncbi:MAG: SDR family NAD(P)-dependent oxidoreductase [Treponema sp.]|nr:SDR family NAD(P)-dependent oxidoreductase [Treponema sp.]